MSLALLFDCIYLLMIFNRISILNFEKYVEHINYIGIKKHSTNFSYSLRTEIVSHSSLFLQLLDLAHLLDWIVVNEIKLN